MLVLDQLGEAQGHLLPFRSGQHDLRRGMLVRGSSGMRPAHPFLVVLFFLAVFVLGVAVGLTHVFWRARWDRRDREKEDQISERR